MKEYEILQIYIPANIFLESNHFIVAFGVGSEGWEEDEIRCPQPRWAPPTRFTAAASPLGISDCIFNELTSEYS